MSRIEPYVQLYNSLLMQIRRGVCNKGIINAKPVLVIALFNSIEKGAISSNAFPFSFELKRFYVETYSNFYPNETVPLMYLPYFHLTGDGFWHIKWKSDISGLRPSDRLLQERSEYGYFDNALWDLLQLQDVREKFIQLLIKTYFSHISIRK